jgi:hypothetical protein
MLDAMRDTSSASVLTALKRGPTRSMRSGGFLVWSTRSSVFASASRSSRSSQGRAFAAQTTGSLATTPLSGIVVRHLSAARTARSVAILRAIAVNFKCRDL